jgi:phage host-nuclease inhibitor protein Gam
MDAATAGSLGGNLSAALHEAGQPIISFTEEAKLVELSSEHELAEALAELASIEQRSAKINAELNLAIARASARATDLMWCEVDGTLVTFADRSEALTAAITNYAKSHRAELLGGLKGKTRELSGGCIKWRDEPDGVEVIGKAEAWIDRLHETHGVAGAVQAAMANVPVTEDGSLTANDVLDVVFRPAISRLTSGVNRHEIGVEALKQAGLKWSKGREKITIKCDVSSVKTETTESQG